MSRKFAVIGAGITGITTAYYLAKVGYEVTVFEAESYPAMMTSYANGGQLSVSNSETWTTWSNVIKGIKWLTDPSAPLLVRPSPSLAKLKWLTGFLYNTALGTYEKNTLATISMGMVARGLYRDIAEEEGIEFDRSDCGILHFYKNKSYLDSAVRSLKMYEERGVDRKQISRNEVFDLEPSLRMDPDIIGGTYTKSDSVGDIHKFCNGLAQVLRSKYKVKFEYDTVIKAAKLLNDRWSLASDELFLGRFSDVVICAGSNSAAVGKLFKESLGVYPVKGYSITITDDAKNLPRMSLLDDQAKIVTSTLGNRLRVAGTAELDGWNRDIRMSRIQPLLDWVKNTMPEVNRRDVKPWAGLRPMTPSMMPIVRAGGMPGVWVNTGHGHLGWTLSPATASHLVNIIKTW